MALKATFVECASPEAIRAQLKKARANASRWDREARELERLLIDRETQIQRGKWPPPTDNTKEN